MKCSNQYVLQIDASDIHPTVSYDKSSDIIVGINSYKQNESNSNITLNKKVIQNMIIQIDGSFYFPANFLFTSSESFTDIKYLVNEFENKYNITPVATISDGSGVNFSVFKNNIHHFCYSDIVKNMRNAINKFKYHPITNGETTYDNLIKNENYHEILFSGDVMKLEIKNNGTNYICVIEDQYFESKVVGKKTKHNIKKKINHNNIFIDKNSSIKKLNFTIMNSTNETVLFNFKFLSCWKSVIKTKRTKFQIQSFRL